ncbi:FmdE family protein [soil metagenome]
MLTMVERETIEKAVAFHGHLCPGLAMGIRATEIGLREIGPHSKDEEVVAVVETDMCAVDAIQSLMGCTFGKGNLIHRDYGKSAYTFIRRSDGRAFRVSTRPDSIDQRPQGMGDGEDGPGGGPDIVESATGSVTVAPAWCEAILSAPMNRLYDVREVKVEMPPHSRGFQSVACASCGEPTMETRVRRFEGRELCPPCFETSLSATEEAR